MHYRRPRFIRWFIILCIVLMVLAVFVPFIPYILNLGTSEVVQ